MKNYVLFALLLLFAVACDDGEADEKSLEMPIIRWENTIELRIEDSKGTDLLNRRNAGYYQDSDIDILESNDASNTVSVQKYSPETDYYYLQLHLNYPKPDIDKGKSYDEELISKVKFGNNETDEIKALYKVTYQTGNANGLGTSSGYTVILQEAWFNGKKAYQIQEYQNTDWELPIIVKVPNN